MLESLESLHMMHALLLLCSCVLAAHFMHYLGQKRLVAAARYSVAGRRPLSTVELTAAIAIALLVSGLIGEALRSAIGSRLVLCYFTPFSLFYA